MHIRGIVKSLYNSTEVLGLGNNLVEVVRQSAFDEHPIISSLRLALEQALKILGQAKSNTNHNTHTELVEDADLERDYAFRAFWMMIEAGTMRRNSTYREAAKMVMSYMEAYDRTLYSFGYDRQTTELNAFLETLNKDVVQISLNTMDVMEWLDELATSQQNFERTYAGKVDEETAKQALIPTKEARDHTINQIKALVNTLNGLIYTDLEGLSELNAKVDQIIEGFESKARARKTRKSAGE